MLHFYNTLVMKPFHFRNVKVFLKFIPKKQPLVGDTVLEYLVNPQSRVTIVAL